MIAKQAKGLTQITILLGRAMIFGGFLCFRHATVCSATPFVPCQSLIESGDIFYKSWDNRSALASYTKAHAQCPNEYEPFIKMARAVIDIGEDNADGASESEPFFLLGLRYSDTLKQRYPDSAQSYFLQAAAAANLARIRKGMSRIAPARIIEGPAKKAITLDPSNAPAYVVLGGFYREVAVASPVLKTFVRIFFKWSPQGTLEDSEKELGKALALSPANIYALLELARTYIASGRRGKAVDILMKMQNLPAVWHLDNKLKQEGRVLLATLQAR